MANDSSQKHSDFPAIHFPCELVLGAVTAPFLLTLIAGKLISQGFQELGQLSEEAFRGDRLPLLKFPSNGSSSTDPHSPDTP